MKIQKKTVGLAQKNNALDALYEDMVNTLIRERYTISNELAILRQRDIKQSEFDAYNEYAAECKKRARELLGALKGEQEN